MLNLLFPVVRCQDVNDAQIVYAQLVVVIIISRSNASFVMIKEELTTFRLFLVCKLMMSFGYDLWIGALNCFSKLSSVIIALEIASMGRPSAKFASLPSFRLPVQSQLSCAIGSRQINSAHLKYSKHSIAKVFTVSPTHIVYADEQGIVHDLQTL